MDDKQTIDALTKALRDCIKAMARSDAIDSSTGGIDNPFSVHPAVKRANKLLETLGAS